jgi:hypothetical protein
MDSTLNRWPLSLPVANVEKVAWVGAGSCP